MLSSVILYFMLYILKYSESYPQASPHPWCKALQPCFYFLEQWCFPCSLANKSCLLSKSLTYSKDGEQQAASRIFLVPCCCSSKTHSPYMPAPGSTSASNRKVTLTCHQRAQAARPGNLSLFSIIATPWTLSLRTPKPLETWDCRVPEPQTSPSLVLTP